MGVNKVFKNALVVKCYECMYLELHELKWICQLHHEERGIKECCGQGRDRNYERSV